MTPTQNQIMKYKPMVKKMVLSKLPSIACKKKLYLRREYKPVTLEYIKELNDFLNGKITEPKDKSILLFDENYKMSEEASKKKIFATKLAKTEKEDYISTRIFNNSTLLFKGEKVEKKGFFGKKSTEHKNEFKNTLFIHFSGGLKTNIGFMMAKNLIDWSKDTGVAIMGIKKPEKETDYYPACLNEYYQTYMWLINHAKEELKMDIHKIIFSGDSMGGNLAMSFLNLLIGIKLFEKKDLKIPDLLLLEYPILSLEVDKMSASMCMGNDGMRFNHDSFKQTVDKYLGDFKDYKNMLVSPLYTPDKIIENLPRIRFIFGEKDMSRDEYLRGVYNIRKCKDIRAYDFVGLYPGFIAIDNPDFYEMTKDFIVEEIKVIIK